MKDIFSFFTPFRGFFVEFYSLTKEKGSLTTMNYKIVSSGSKGNCVIINDVMIDAGVPFSKIKDDLYHIKYLILTHTHSDHMKFETLTKIAMNFPRIIIIGNYEVNQVFKVNKIANAGFDVETEDYIFSPFEAEHDVLCYGYSWTYEDKQIIYCTDTGSLDNAPDGIFDYFFLESNHDEEKLEKARDQRKGTYNPYLSGKRHLSTQAAKAFYYLHRRSAESELIELHKSSRFY
jgi:ribonuclease BN (tRNA processing enzyme)